MSTGGSGEVGNALGWGWVRKRQVVSNEGSGRNRSREGQKLRGSVRIIWKVLRGPGSRGARRQNWREWALWGLVERGGLDGLGMGGLKQVLWGMCSYRWSCVGV